MYLSKRNGVYYLWWKDDAGKRRKVSTHSKTKTEALQFLREFNQQENERRRTLKPIALPGFQEIYLDFSRSIHTKKTVRSNRTALRELTEFVGADTAMHTIKRADCERFLAKKTSKASAWTARMYRLALGAIFERAKTWGHVLENPWRKVAKPRPPEVLPVFFTREEFKTLRGKIVDRDFRDLVTVAALTGLRSGELRAMEWDWLDLSRRTLTVKNSEHFKTKSKRTRVVPLCDEALTVLVGRRERTKSPPVFTRGGRVLTESYVSHAFKKVVDAAELPSRLHFHSLRHTFASWLVQDGVSLYQVARLLGHSSTAVTEIYAHLVPQDMHNVLAPLHLEN